MSKPETNRVYKYGAGICASCGRYTALRRDLQFVKHGKRKWKPEGCPGGNLPERTPQGC